MNKIRILETIYDGYERLYLLELTKVKRIWAYGLDHQNYIESGFDKNVIEVEGEPNFSIEWVTAINEDNFESDELIQSINNSSHSDCKVTVTKVISSDSFECFLEGLGLMLVEAETDIDKDKVKIGSKLSFSGNLRIDFNDN